MTDNIAGLILAGGQSRRMGGGEKFLQPFAGETMLAHVVRRLAPQVANFAISANCAPELVATYGEVVPDRRFLDRGPLGGIWTGLSWLEERWTGTHLVSVPADSPFLPLDLVTRLQAETTRDETAIIVASSNGRPHPVFALWPLAAKHSLEHFLEQGLPPRMMDFISAYGYRSVEFPHLEGFDPFLNVNTPEEFEQAEQMVKRT